MTKVFIGDTKTKIRLNAGVSISAATKIEIHYKKPDGTEGIWAAILEDINYAYYLTTASDLDQNGVWKVQLYVEFDDWKGHGEISSFTVYETL